MKNSAPILAVAGMLLAGCSMLKDERAHVMDTPCTSSSGAICVINVTMESCTRIRADPQHARVADNDRGDIEWRLVSAPTGWAFAGNGIDFKNPHSDFTNRRNMRGNYKWHNAHNVKQKRHPYTINLTNGSQTCSEDPSIMN
jgi:hypothetical protein